MILGGGLAGLSAAYHLGSRPAALIEKETGVGGTARSFSVNGFTFDFTGHLLHLHNNYTRALITDLLGKNFYRCQRNAWIFSCDTYTRYPFQANTFGLPESVVRDCVIGFLENYLERGTDPLESGELNFREWCEAAFGAGISKHFMVPYNEKLYQVPADRMTAEWCGSFVPTPKLEEVVRGALTDQSAAFGYNTEFLYPKEGGIQSLARGLAQRIKAEVRLNTTIKHLHWRQKEAEFSDGGRLSYHRLVNTIPLPELLNVMDDLPQDIEEARAKLRYASVLCLNIGVRRANISDKSWIYFPEKPFPFYRVGFPMNFTPHAVPRGCSSMYVELPFSWVANKNEKVIINEVRQALIRCRILRASDELPVTQFLPIRYAYVLYDRDRRDALQKIFPFLREYGIDSIGRYGAWKYSFMEEAILDGKAAAESISKS